MKIKLATIITGFLILTFITSPTVSAATPTLPVTNIQSAPCPVIGDTNNCDGKVNILDYTFLSSQMGTNNHKADLNGDNAVNILDYTILSISFGK